VVDHRQRIVGWNRGAERLLGYAAADVLHRACLEVIAGCGLNGQPVWGPDCSVHRRVEGGKTTVQRTTNVSGDLIGPTRIRRSTFTAT
jgi:PAS domain-containing protein